jgi:hypothetical protein
MRGGPGWIDSLMPTTHDSKALFRAFLLSGGFKFTELFGCHYQTTGEKWQHQRDLKMPYQPVRAAF